MNPNMTEIKAPIAKGASAVIAAVGANTDVAGQVATSAAQAMAPTADTVWYWSVVGMPWDKIASLVAAVYTSLLLTEWVIKRIWRAWLRPLSVRLGWVDGEPMLTRSEWADLAKDDR